MKRYYVVTPPVGYVDVVIPETGQGPWVEECDVIEIEAESKRDAVLLGVREMLKRREYHYCREQRADGCSPYTGVKALDADIADNPPLTPHQDCDCMSCRPWTS